MSTEDGIVICMGSSCFARGNRGNLDTAEQFLDGHGLKTCVRLAGSRCAGECRKGPNVTISGTAHHGVDNGTLLDLLDAEFNACGKK